MVQACRQRLIGGGGVVGGVGGGGGGTGHVAALEKGRGSFDKRGVTT